jgi:bacteriocin-like protein
VCLRAGTVTEWEGHMTKTKTSKKSEKSADKLIKPTKKEDIELTEEELKKISGGPIYMKYQSPS